MEKKNILTAICRMAEDDNKSLIMSATTLDGGTINGISGVRFRTSQEVTGSAIAQAIGLPSQYLCCAFFIKRSELKKYM